MRHLTIVLFTCLSIGFATTQKANAQTNSLNGTWIPVKQEMGGTSLPEAAFVKQKLVMLDSNYTFTAESVDKGIATYSNGKMDIYSKEGVNAGRHFPTIYKLENSQLFICYNLSGNGYPETFDTKGKPMYFLCVYKKELWIN